MNCKFSHLDLNEGYGFDFLGYELFLRPSSPLSDVIKTTQRSFIAIIQGSTLYFTYTVNRYISGSLVDEAGSKDNRKKYPCDKFDYSAGQLQHLKQHKGFKHGGIRYPCDQCEYSLTRADRLELHKEKKRYLF